MLIPKFTIRRLLAITTLFAVFSLVATFAVRGQPWAIAVVVAVFGLAMGFGAYLFFFVVARIFSAIGNTIAPQRPSSPFAHHRPPPQIISPDEPT